MWTEWHSSPSSLPAIITLSVMQLAYVLLSPDLFWFLFLFYFKTKKLSCKWNEICNPKCLPARSGNWRYCMDLWVELTLLPRVSAGADWPGGAPLSGSVHARTWSLGGCSTFPLSMSLGLSLPSSTDGTQWRVGDGELIFKVSRNPEGFWHPHSLEWPNLGEVFPILLAAPRSPREPALSQFFIWD